MQSQISTTDDLTITKTQTRYIRDGLVGVVYGPDFGAGFSTWGKPEMATDPKIVELALALIDEYDTEDDTGSNELDQQMARYVKQTYDRTYFSQSLAVAWLNPGTRFYIQEYDGSEQVITENDMNWSTA